MDEPSSPTPPAVLSGNAPAPPPDAGAVSSSSNAAAEEEASAAVLDGFRALPPRRRHRAEAADEAAPASPDAEILLLTGRLQELIARRREPEATPAATPASTRLRPRAAAQRVAATTAAPPEEAAAAVLADVGATLPTMEARRPATGPTPEERLEAATDRWGRLGGRLLAFLVLPAAAFLVGRLTAPAPAHPSPEQTQATEAAKGQSARAPRAAEVLAAIPRWTPATLARLEEAFTLLTDGGNVAQPTALLLKLREDSGPLPGLDLLIVEMYIRAGKSQEAVASLLPLYRATPPVAQACDELGFVSARGRRLDEAAGYFATAAEGDPLCGLYFYHWGEALRRQGKVEEAIQRFEQAMRRRPVFGDSRPAPPGTLVRLNLARLEAGRGAEVRRETEDRLKKLPPGTPDQGQALIVLAAADLQDGRYAEAGTRLGQARDLLTPIRNAGGVQEFEVLLNDYFFRAFANRPELAGVMPPASSEAETRRVAALNGSAEVCFIDP